ncbi:GTP 3',8-cyclase MoaA [uncultured Nevskia sp.]|uniref:GTP 3',8-cyclase MoaA n=1 Tax=uncultured Nevskia sp. TaxID=228950 RepID=UPI0025F888D4|nr:GTP 3',8-cyclase MoaA [uncultured Nevskia sp.]
MTQLSRPTATAPLPIQDRFGRIKRKLRISLTDRCNFRCPYCMPERPEFMDRADRLSRVELSRILMLFVGELGVNRLRLTGGEPLLRRDLEGIIEDAQALRPFGLERISLTTNAALLEKRAPALKAAGVDDLNISLDAMDPTIFAKLSGGRSIKPVLAGIVAARDAGIPVKLNAVIIRGINEGEILPLARYAAQEKLPLRYIEFMPLDGRGEWTRDRVVPQADILDHLRAEFAVNALPRSNDPAAYYELNDGNEIGIIATVSNPFCASCDRLRITADGSLYPCLFSKNGISLRDPMRNGADDAALSKLIRATVWNKDAGYAANPGYSDRPIAMNSLGG